MCSLFLLSHIHHPSSRVQDPSLAFGAFEDRLRVGGFLVAKSQAVRAVGVDVQLKGNAVIGKCVRVNQRVLYGYQPVLGGVPDKCGRGLGVDVLIYGIVCAILGSSLSRAAKQIERACVTVMVAGNHGVAQHRAGGAVQIIVLAANRRADLGQIKHGAAGCGKVTACAVAVDKDVTRVNVVLFCMLA